MTFVKFLITFPKEGKCGTFHFSVHATLTLKFEKNRDDSYTYYELRQIKDQQNELANV